MILIVPTLKNTVLAITFAIAFVREVRSLGCHISSPWYIAENVQNRIIENFSDAGSFIVRSPSLFSNKTPDFLLGAGVQHLCAKRNLPQENCRAPSTG